MKHFLNANRRFFLYLPFLFLFLIFSSCQKKLDYMDYVSELRSNIFLAEEEEFSLRIYAVFKESPYLADGIVRETSNRMEAHLVTTEGWKTCRLSLEYEGKTYSGEMSFDNIKSEYYLSLPLDVSKASELSCKIEYEEKKIDVVASSVKSASTLSPEKILNVLQEKEEELFSSLTDKYGFGGEIYLRLIYEDAAYYYVGIIDRNGKNNAFLLNATTGVILAKRIA